MRGRGTVPCPSPPLTANVPLWEADAAEQQVSLTWGPRGHSCASGLGRAVGVMEGSDSLEKHRISQSLADRRDRGTDRFKNQKGVWCWTSPRETSGPKRNLGALAEAADP